MIKGSYYSLIVLLLYGIFVSFDVSAKSNKCHKYQQKYQDIQAKQRQPNNNKRSNKLKEKARKIFHQWRQCKQGKIK